MSREPILICVWNDYHILVKCSASRPASWALERAERIGRGLVSWDYTDPLVINIILIFAKKNGMQSIDRWGPDSALLILDYIHFELIRARNL